MKNIKLILIFCFLFFGISCGENYHLTLDSISAPPPILSFNSISNLEKNGLLGVSGTCTPDLNIEITLPSDLNSTPNASPISCTCTSMGTFDLSAPECGSQSITSSVLTLNLEITGNITDTFNRTVNSASNPFNVICTSIPPASFSNKTIFDHTGSDQFFDASTGTLGNQACWFKIKAWGAGGGSSFSHGGAGGYVETYIQKMDLPDSNLLVVVGSGGNHWAISAPATIYGGGGRGGQTGANQQGSSGGGLSGIFDATSFSTAQINDSIVIAGAGSGIGKDDNFVKNPRVHGAPGGGLVASNGGNSLSGACLGGKGGSQASGGAAGAGGSRPAVAGGPLRGGTGGGTGLTGANQGGGGGGSGYYGGGGGCGSGSHAYREASGGGGSSFIPSIDNGDGFTLPGIGRDTPNTADLDYRVGVGLGGQGNNSGLRNAGGNGLVVIEWD